MPAFRTLVSSTTYDYRSGRVTDELAGRSWLDAKIAGGGRPVERALPHKDGRSLMPTKTRRDSLRERARRAALKRNGGAARICGKAANGRGLWLSRAAIALAAKQEGIRWPVSVRWATAGELGRATARHGFRGGVHLIFLRDDLDAQESRVSLGHELRHCADQEATGTRAQFRARYEGASRALEFDAERQGRRIARTHVAMVGSR